MHAPFEYEELKVSAIVPAYNEAKNILHVLEPLKQVPAIKEIILVSDGSRDETARLAEELGGVKVLALPQNVGKTKAVARGVDEARHPTILLCDADLVNLKKEHVSELIRKYCEGWDMVILEMGSQPWVFQRLLQSTPALSGTRIFDRENFFKVPFRETDRFQFETRIND
jgi:glycosyltransferase involved in cell wall biosynthesis